MDWLSSLGRDAENFGPPAYAIFAASLYIKAASTLAEPIKYTLFGMTTPRKITRIRGTAKGRKPKHWDWK